MNERPWVVREIERDNYAVMRSSRYGEPRGFLCCEWWCEGLWASAGYYNLCSPRPVIPSHKSTIGGLFRGLASPSAFPRSKLLIHFWGLIRERIRNSLNRASINELPSAPSKVSHVKVSTKVLIIGGGIAGLSLARELSRLGIDSVIVEGEDYLGGHLTFDESEVKNLGQASSFMANLVKDVEGDPRVKVYRGVIFDGFLEDAVIGHSRSGDLLFSFDYKYVVFATGAREVPLVFPGNNTARMITGLTALKLTRSWGLRLGSVLVWGSDDWGVRVAINLKRAGARVYLGDHSAIVRSDLYRGDVEKQGIESFIGYNIVSAKDEGDGIRITLESLRGRKAKRMYSRQEVKVDVVVSTIRVPALELPTQLGAQVVYVPELGGLVPRHGFTGSLGINNAYVLGDAGGLMPEHLVLRQARVVALSIGANEGLVGKDVLDREVTEFKTELINTNPGYYNALLRMEQGLHGTGYYAEPNVVYAPMWAAAGTTEDVENALRTANRQYLCLCEDVTLNDVLNAVKVLMHTRELRVKVLHGEEEEYRSMRLPSMERIKRVVGLGTGPCQGKFCVVSTNLILSFIFQKKPGEMGLIKFRFPEHPIPMATLTGGE
ncbi:FAD-dependent oxidoreductase [Vulcanisaeta thermophila]|uniref:FAD-dependent oxidoreductase n=1 Tax=Vulcanisaeta thermophila TaxID=867917 RepID=UPI000852C889|nr:FAD-dependent oxidoreductase [Vulcanisaeta thermophila]